MGNVLISKKGEIIHNVKDVPLDTFHVCDYNEEFCNNLPQKIIICKDFHI